MQVLFTAVAIPHSFSAVAPLNAKYVYLTARAGRPSVGRRRTACSSLKAAKDGSSACSAPAVDPMAVREPSLRTEECAPWLHPAAGLTMPSSINRAGRLFHHDLSLPGKRALCTGHFKQGCVQPRALPVQGVEVAARTGRRWCNSSCFRAAFNAR